MIYNIRDIEPLTEKAKGLINLQNKGLDVPLTFLTRSKSDIENVLEIINQQQITFKTYYIRLNFSDKEYPHHFATFANPKSLKEKYLTLFQKAQEQNKTDFDVIIQPMLKTYLSGGIIVKDDNLLIEIVHGNPRMLFRNGIFHKRFLSNSKLEILDSKEGYQSFSLTFNNSNLKLEKTPFLEFTFNLEDLKNYIDKLSNNCLYEFTLSNNHIIFLQEKPNFADSYQQLIKGKFSNPFVVYDGSLNSGVARVYDLPSFEHINRLNKLDKVIVKNGAYLSHFATYLSENKIHCEFYS